MKTSSNGAGVKRRIKIVPPLLTKRSGNTPLSNVRARSHRGGGESKPLKEEIADREQASAWSKRGTHPSGGGGGGVLVGERQGRSKDSDLTWIVDMGGKRKGKKGPSLIKPLNVE